MSNTEQSPSPNATRRVPLEVDAQGNPTFASITSPESFKQGALCVRPPHTVIPIIFVPGIMGTNLVNTKLNIPVWTPPTTGWEKASEAIHRLFQSPSEREIELDPDNTAVSADGRCALPSNSYWLTTEEAKRRGWGELHADSYHGIMLALENTLNEQYAKPGHTEENGNHLLVDIGMLSELGVCTNEDVTISASTSGKPDYKLAAEKACEAWNVCPSPLTKNEIRRLDRYYYPVWACGYNWLQDNDLGADRLQQRIQEVLDFYKQSKYFHCDGKVILVTHSMGGLVSRAAAKKNPSNILGVVHGVQPIAGAPVAYRRFRAGTEVPSGQGVVDTIQNAGAALVLGWSAASTTPVMARSPGALELLPTCDYPTGWLKFTDAAGNELMPSLPESDPYEEIYGKTTDECWWGMVNPKQIDPTGDMKNDNKDPVAEYRNALKVASGFHFKLGLYSHEQTYGYYGIDNSKNTAFGTVVWSASDSIRRFSSVALKNITTKNFDKYGDSTLPTENEDSAEFSLSNVRDQPGDGTVPQDSGALLAKLSNPAKVVFKIAGFDHQHSYADGFSIQATIYSIAKLAQQAKPAIP